MAVLAPEPAVVARAALAARGGEFLFEDAAVAIFRAQEHTRRAADDVLRRITQNPLRRRVPRADAAFLIERDDGVVLQRVDEQPKVRLRFAQHTLDRDALLTLRAFAQSTPHDGRQPLQALLQHVIGRAALEHLDRVLFAEQPRHEDERRIGRALDRDRQRFDAGEGRHDEVGEDHVERLGFQLRHEFGFVVDNLRIDRIVGAFKLGERQLRIERVVFDKKQVQRLHGLDGLAGKSSRESAVDDHRHARHSFTGGRRKRIEPGGGSLSTAQNTPRSAIASTNSENSTGLTT